MLSFTVYKFGDTALFRCTGRLVSGDSECLRDAILTQSHVRSVVLDLAEIHSMDAAGLGMLLSLRARARTTGTAFKLMNLTPRVEELFALTNLRDVFEFCSVPEMLALMCLAVGQTRAVAAVQVERPRPLSGRPVASNCANVSDRAA